MNEEEILFEEAAALAPEARAAYLDAACAGNPKMRARLDGLLRSHEASGFMKDRTAAPFTLAAPSHACLPAEESGTVIGRYKLLQEIGEGGFGVVWMAEQEEPVRRRVALKILKAGMDTREVIARFEAERQALALMDHPNIARIFDAGETATGRPFIVMELVRGLPITRFCDEKTFTARQRLELFLDVCSAVAHAHQKGIIHRDIKPSNVMVTMDGDKPVPKVIDFGIAKATQGRLTDRTLFTRFEQFVGTPAYTSPEQTAMSGLDVDTRSDIYSLGVLLYELLTGKPPFETKSLLFAGYDEMRRIIREVEPPRPSARLATAAGDERTTLARARHVTPEKLTRLVEPDLDWIVMKAIEKDRTRRYETANGLARDIKRFLAGELVSATPPGAAYRLRKAFRRHRLAFAAGGAIAASLLIGLGLAIQAWHQAGIERDAALAAREGEERQKSEATAAAKMAAESELQARRLQYVADMNLAQQALRSNDLGLGRLLVDRHRTVPGEPGPDLRGWEWRWLYQQCLSEAQAKLSTRDGWPVYSASFSPDGTWLIVGYADGQVELWDVSARKRERVVQVPFDLPARAVFSPREEIFAATMEPDVVKTVDLRTGAEVTLCTVAGSVRDLSWSPDGDWLAVLCGNPDLVKVMRVADGAVIMDCALSSGGGAFFNNARISPDRQWIYVSSGASNEPVLRCLSLSDRREVWQVPIGLIDEGNRKRGSDSGFSAMALSPNGEILVVATGYRDPRIRVLNAADGQPLERLEGHTRYVLQLAFSGDGRILASTSEDQTIRLWDTSTWDELRPPLLGHGHEVNAVAFAGQGEGGLLASGGKDGDLLLWDVRAAPPERGTGELPASVTRVLPVPASRLIAGGNPDFRWRLIDPVTLDEESVLAVETSTEGGRFPLLVPRECRRLLPPLEKIISSLPGRVTGSAVHPDGKLRVVVSESGEIEFINTETQVASGPIRSHLPSIFGVAFSPDGDRLVLSSGGDDGIVVWDIATRMKLATLSSSGSLLGSLLFAADGSTLLAAPQHTGRSGSGAFQVWHAPSFQEIDEVEKAHGSWPTASAFLARNTASLASLKNDLEQELRRRVTAAGAGSEVEAARLNQSLEYLADLLFHERREAEARKYLNDLLEGLKRQPSSDARRVFETTKKLLIATLAHLRKTDGASDIEERDRLSAQADQLVTDMLEVYARSAAEAPENTYLALRSDMLQSWFQGSAVRHLENVRRMIQRAEADAANDAAMCHAATACCLTRSGDAELNERALALAQTAVKLLDARVLALAKQAEERAKERLNEDALEKAQSAVKLAEQHWLVSAMNRVRDAEETSDHPDWDRAAHDETLWDVATYHKTLGLAHYRCGNYRKADEALLVAYEAVDATGWWFRHIFQLSVRFIRSTILHHEGRREEARRIFDEAVEIMEDPIPEDRRTALERAAVIYEIALWMAWEEAAKALLPEPSSRIPPK